MEALALSRLRARLGRTWLIVLFGVTYLVSQATILAIVEPLGSSLARLQLLGFSAEVYRSVFREWQAAGLLDVYRSHFVVDDVHWLWYSGLFTAVLCRLFERERVPHRHDWILLLPLASGLLDAYENRLQHVFLSAPDFSRIVDPLPLWSTLASIAKWTLAATYVSLTAWLLARGALRRGSASAAG